MNPVEIDVDISWSEFLSRHDMLWTRTPRDWVEAPWLGNGLIGCILWQEGERLRLQVFRRDVEDHRGFEYGYVGYTRSRLQIGSFYHPLDGSIKSCHWRLILHRAALIGEIVTESGRLSIDLFVHTHEPITYCSLRRSGEHLPVAWMWEPAEAKSTRSNLPEIERLCYEYATLHGVAADTKIWEPNPPPYIETYGSMQVSVQELLSGGQHAVTRQIENDD